MDNDLTLIDIIERGMSQSSEAEALALGRRQIEFMIEAGILEDCLDRTLSMVYSMGYENCTYRRALDQLKENEDE